MTIHPRREFPSRIITRPLIQPAAIGDVPGGGRSPVTGPLLTAPDRLSGSKVSRDWFPTAVDAHESDRAQGELVFERLPYDPAAWETILEHYPDAEVFHGSAWLAFLAASQDAEPVVAVLRADGRPVGHFVGAIVRRFGARILGSPLRGWATERMGFLLEPGVDRTAAAKALLPFAFGALRCLHVELADKHLTAEQMAGLGYCVDPYITYVVDLDATEEEILARMHPKTRQHIRTAIRSGLHAEVATDLRFADEYLEQLRYVFTRQGLVPTYGAGRVRQLAEALQPAGQILLLRIRGLDGLSLSTGVVVARNENAVIWGTASFHQKSRSHPTQLLWWEAMRYWRARGVLRCELGGAGAHMAQYGGVVTPSPRFYRSRFAAMRYGRTMVRRLMTTRQAIAGRAASRTLA
jgi:CelD/BcsL family acetyltransferase involved in cellulose biosynthesis